MTDGAISLQQVEAAHQTREEIVGRKLSVNMIADGEHVALVGKVRSVTVEFQSGALTIDMEPIPREDGPIYGF